MTITATPLTRANATVTNDAPSAECVINNIFAFAKEAPWCVPALLGVGAVAADLETRKVIGSALDRLLVSEGAGWSEVREILEDYGAALSSE